MLLDEIESPADLKGLAQPQLDLLAEEIRQYIVTSVSKTGGHLGSNLGVVELTLALHRVFDSPRDVILWDTGHQAYVHKLLTGRRQGFAELRQAGGLSGYPTPSESPHDWISNSHASTALSYAHGLSTAFAARGEKRRVIAVVGDGAMTGGMAYEALNNLGHSGRRAIIVLNDNGRSYAPTIWGLNEHIAKVRLHPAYRQSVEQLSRGVRALPGPARRSVGLWRRVKNGVREVVEPRSFFELLGLRYVGPLDGHDLAALEEVLELAAQDERPVVVHVITQKGRGYPPAETDIEKCLHDVSAFDPVTGISRSGGNETYTQVFSEELLRHADSDSRIVAITAAMPGSTGLLPLQAKYPDQVIDVGIAEQHAVTMAAGLAMGGMRPVLALYSTFFTRAIDQFNLDVALHELPVVVMLDRAGITGEDGPSHHGTLDMGLCLRVPGVTVLAPSSGPELRVMFDHALRLGKPVVIRFPKGGAQSAAQVGSGLKARRTRVGTSVCILSVGRLLQPAEEAAHALEDEGVSCSVWDVRAVKPLDSTMLEDAARHRLVVTVEDGMVPGGVGQHMVERLHASSEGATFSALCLGTPDRFIPQGSPIQILADLGLDAPGITAAVRKAWKEA